MKIRQATIDDIPAIQLLSRELDHYHAELLPDVFRPLTEDARPDSMIREWIENPDSDYLVAEIDGKVVGFLNVRKAGNPPYPMFRPHEVAMIENAVVEKSLRGQGIGNALFDAAIAWAREHGLEFVQTMVWFANKETREFYLRKGFEPMIEKLELKLRTRKHET